MLITPTESALLSSESGTMSREKPPFRTLHDDIYASLRSALMSGDLAPGQAVSIRTLAEQFGTSIIPVRDAVKRLVTEQALTMLPNRAVVVSAMTRRRFQEILYVRLNLETQLARLATELITPAAIKELALVNDQMTSASESGDVKAYLAANQRFHFKLYTAAQSAVMLPIVESLWMQAGPFMSGVFNGSGIRDAHDNHNHVIKALRRRDSNATAAAVHDDLADAADTVLAGTFIAGEAEAAAAASELRAKKVSGRRLAAAEI